MKIEEEFLTIKQARELKKLGVSFNSANFGIYNFYESLAEDEVNEIRKLDYALRSKLVTETLSIAEMIEILPIKIDIDIKEMHPDDESHYMLKVNLSINSNSVSYRLYSKSLPHCVFVYQTFYKDNLRDSLFDMIKFLKQNKLI